MNSIGDIQSDGIFIIGFDPDNQLVPAITKMNADGYVCADEKCETSLPGIFAVGDLREKYGRQIVLSAARPPWQRPIMWTPRDPD